MLTTVVKRNGQIEEFHPSKINQWSQWAAHDLKDRVDWSEVVLSTVKTSPDRISTQDLQSRLIKQCLEKNNWAYSLMAGRLYVALFRKELFPDNRIPSVRDIHKRLVDAGLMKAMDYSPEEYQQIEKIIVHERDFNMVHFQLVQMRKKYSLIDRVRRIDYETPQFVYMRMAMSLAEDEPRNERLMHIREWYDHFSLNRLNAPTPNYLNLGTHHNGYASCCLYTTDDSARSIGVGDHIAYTMTYMSAGIGGFLNVRSIGNPVRGGMIEHQGRLPYYRQLAGSVKANLQGGRGGACTTYYTCYDPEAMTIAMLQNPRTPKDKQNRDIHFAMMYNKFFARKAARNEQIFTFNQYTCPDLMKAFFSGNGEMFEVLYQHYEEDPSFPKQYVSAREVLLTATQQSHEVATHYFLAIDEVNRHTSFKDPIYSSNLCVAPETLILTDRGYSQIKHFRDQTIKIWNGQDFSEVEVRRTSEFAKLLRVFINHNLSLYCTPHHKFYIKDADHPDGMREVCTQELEEGMELIDYDLPLIEGDQVLNNPYENGFYAATGFARGPTQRIHLYGTNRGLAPYFEDGSEWEINDLQERMQKHYTTLHDVSFVPDASYTVDSRLKWLAGLLDGNGVYTKTGIFHYASYFNVNRKFIEEVFFLLQTLGIQAEIRDNHDLGQRSALQSELKNTRTTLLLNSRIVIDHFGLKSLKKLGLDTHRLMISDEVKDDFQHHPVNRITGIVDEKRYDETYCFTEPKRGMGMFNGVLTGNCVEITIPTSPYEDVTDLYKKDDIPSGEVGLCSLAAIVVPNIRTDEVYESVAYYALKMIDKCIHRAHYELPQIGHTATSRLNAGVGITGMATTMARKGLDYNCPAGLEEIHRIAERHAYYVIKASLRLGKELGNAPWIDKTKWPEGWLPIDTYARSIDQIVEPKYRYDWDALRKDIIRNGGIRNSSLIAHMPVESSSKASGAPNGVYPIRDLTLKKTDLKNTIDWCATDSDILGDQYQRAWALSTEDLCKVYGIIQKFTDQSISADFYEDRVKYPILESSRLIQDFLYMPKYGIKAKYYQNSLTSVDVKLGDLAPNDKADCGSGGCTL